MIYITYCDCGKGDKHCIRFGWTDEQSKGRRWKTTRDNRTRIAGNEFNIFSLILPYQNPSQASLAGPSLRVETSFVSSGCSFRRCGGDSDSSNGAEASVGRVARETVNVDRRERYDCGTSEEERRIAPKFLTTLFKNHRGRAGRAGTHS